MAADGAYSAAGGHQGKGHAWAKGRDKHAAATPQLSQPAAPKPAATPSHAARKTAKAHEKASAPGAATRQNHLTICHRTGNGGYIVISPNVNGAINGHLSHHDDFVYVDGCRQPAPAPAPNPVPEPGPKAPAEGTTVGVAPATAVSASELPFTGFPAALILLCGASLLATGLGLRRLGRS